MVILALGLALALAGCSATGEEISGDGMSFSGVEDLGESITFSDGEDIFITESGVYEFAGDYKDSIVTVNVNKDADDGTVYLVLNGANITSEIETPINIIEAKEVAIVLEGENTINQGQITTTDEEFPSAAIYSKADTVITGDGSLTVTTAYKDGINSRDELIIESGNIIVNAVEDGIAGKDLLEIKEAIITVDAGKDGLKSSNAEDPEKGNIMITSGTFNIMAGNDAISSDNALQIDAGDFELYSGGGFVEVIKTAGATSGGMSGGAGGGMGSGGTGGMVGMNEGAPDAVDENSMPVDEDELTLDESMKTLKAVNNIIINGGTFKILAYEDAVHSDGDILINSGNFEITAGDDAVHAEKDLIINDGTIDVLDCYEGIEAQMLIEVNGGYINVNSNDDCFNASDNSNGTIRINAGEIIIRFYGQGADGFDTNHYLEQTGGSITILNEDLGNNKTGAFCIRGTMSILGGTITDSNGDPVDMTNFGMGVGAEDKAGGQGSGTMPGGGQGGGMMPGGGQGGGMVSGGGGTTRNAQGEFGGVGS